MEAKLKHLDFIQTIISRMAQNSFLIKGWAITLVSALFALASNGSNQKFISVAAFPIVFFWILDSYYLYQERIYREVYDHARVQENSDLSLNTKQYVGFVKFLKAACSSTIILFYVAMSTTMLIVKYWI